MSVIQKQIYNFKKQNEGMEKSFLAKGITYTKLNIDGLDPETELLLLKEYNDYLKKISKENRPVEIKKEPATHVAEPKKEKLEVDTYDYDEEIKEVKPSYSTITNMEDIKRAFFSNEYETFRELIQPHSFKYYSATYKYADDYIGRPNYVAKNLLRGFVQGLEDCRKYFMICFRCVLTNNVINEYNYPSYWIVNTTDDLKTVLGSLYDDYEFTLIENDSINQMLKKMEKNTSEEDNSFIGEAYLH